MKSIFYDKSKLDKNLQKSIEDDRKILDSISKKFDFQEDTIVSAENFIKLYNSRNPSVHVGRFLQYTFDEFTMNEISKSNDSKVINSILQKIPKPKHMCLSPTCKNQAGKNKHVISKSSTLSSIKENMKTKNVVLYVHYNEFKKEFSFEEKGIKVAATFSGFCDNCDNTIFSTFENNNFKLCKKTALLLNWRSTLNALLRKSKQIHKRMYLMKNKDKIGLPNHFGIADNLKSNLHDFSNLLKFSKILYNEINYKTKNTQSAFIEFPNPAPWVAAGSFSKKKYIRMVENSRM